MKKMREKKKIYVDFDDVRPENVFRMLDSKPFQVYSVVENRKRNLGDYKVSYLHDYSFNYDIDWLATSYDKVCLVK